MLKYIQKLTITDTEINILPQNLFCDGVKYWITIIYKLLQIAFLPHIFLDLAEMPHNFDCKFNQIIQTIKNKAYETSIFICGIPSDIFKFICS